MKNIVDYYNEIVENKQHLNSSVITNGEVLRRFYDCFAVVGTLSPKLLDLGCGTGEDAKFLSRLKAKVKGVDFSENSINIANINPEKCKFFVGDITEPLNELGYFDGVLCLETIIHIDIQKMRMFFNNVSNILKKGGLFLVSCVEGQGKNFEKSFVELNGETFNTDFYNYTLLELCGFSIPNFKLVDCWTFDSDSDWKYYVFEKK